MDNIMNGKINEYGYLEIYRKKKYVTQRCPYTFVLNSQDQVEGRFCGDRCPHFSEPIPNTWSSKNKVEITITAIETCKHILEFEKFTDERK